ncbi:MAG: hypothetical protein C0505_10090 [Leptothrix sp. (in: Bacteria)]|nr:hypothetical protein [Leptothrix sp. (in: b-proteobacteria)]
MPYYVYAVKPFAQLELLAEFDAFKPASVHAKTLRGTPAAAEPTRIKVMFAENPQAAEDLLLQVRVAGPSGDE